MPVEENNAGKLSAGSAKYPPIEATTSAKYYSRGEYYLRPIIVPMDQTNGITAYALAVLMSA
jgi:hypothetical protein